MSRRWLLLMCIMLASDARAQVPLQGSFSATEACPAVQSMKNGSNPGNVTVAAGIAYVLVGKNRADATHYLIEIPDAVPSRRWVPADCGSINSEVSPEAANSHTDGLPFFVLAMTWQPAFCETMSDKRECRSQTSHRYDASHFALHGLWPQPRSKVFCNVDPVHRAASESGRWSKLPAPPVSAETRTRLERMMPGTQSFLDRHEWIKHGSCYRDGSAEAYFRDALRLMEAINASPVRVLLAGRAGKALTSRQIRRTFDSAFGQGAGERVRVACKSKGRRRLIVEITVGLRGDLASGASLSELILAARPTDPGCPEGLVDPVGLQ